MQPDSFDTIFKKGSTTYYYSSIFFPPKIRDDVFVLYAFVRTADDYVDAIPQDIDSFTLFVKETHKALSGTSTGNTVIDSFAALIKKRNFEHEWVWGFLKAMSQDVKKNKYETFEELETYMYGSAEVIGMMMCRIMDLKDEALPAARNLGKAMQLINFIRDVREDISLGRQYLPVSDMKEFGLSHFDDAITKKDAFASFIRFEIERYRTIQKEAEKGYKYIPRSFLLPIKTASDMYKWTADQIYKDPFVIFEKKVKPTPYKVVLSILKNSLV